jgi:GH15 family glucan-1,4-alpha-glucosidase
VSYKPIQEYGVIGDLHSVALVGKDGSIDWCCLPRFDSPSIFAALLDDEKGGYFKIHTPADDTCRQMYLPDTNVLVTRFLSAEGVGEVVDFMPVSERQSEKTAHQIVRIVRSIRGNVHFRMECFPAFDYARERHRVQHIEGGVVFESPSASIVLTCRQKLERQGSGVWTEFVLEPRQSAVFALTQGEAADRPVADVTVLEQEVLWETIHFWRSWVARSNYAGRWREVVDRSALVLKLMTYQPTGAIVAAPTCSLPEAIGGMRNWDYRYTWIRDAAFTTYAFLRLGYTSEAARFIEWLQHRAGEPGENGPLQVMYRVDGSHDLVEEELTHLKGYRDSRPVRIGNAAFHQLQLDIYGELIDAIYLYNKYASPISWDLWQYLVTLLDWVCDNWERCDYGIWERRMEPQQLVSSKVQCWVALDRGLRIAEKRRLPVEFERIRRECDRVYAAVMRDGWNSDRGTFTQTFHSDIVDASSLLMPLMLFVSPTDPRMLATLDAILDQLVSDSLVYRYRLGGGQSDGLEGREGTFSMCTFWLAESLARAGRVDEARLIFEKMLTYANHLGLFGEQIGGSGETLGNFPQAFTHLALISAALALDRKLGGRP